MSSSTTAPSSASASSSPVAAQAPPAGPRWTRRLAETPEIGVIAACVVVFVAIFTAKHTFASEDNLQEMGRNLFEFGVLAIGESMVILTGGIDLSVGALAALAAVLSSWLFVTAGLPLGPTVVLTLLACGTVGLAHGLFVTKLGVAPFVITLVTFTAARGGAQAITGSVPITISGASFAELNRTNYLGVPVPVIILVIVAVLAWFFLERTYLGRQTYATGGNLEAARLAGIKTHRRIITAYVTSAVLAGIVGILIASRLGIGDPSVANGYELQAIAASVIGGVSLVGGQGRIMGIVAGAVLLVIINNGLIVLNVSPYYQQIVLGAVLAIAVIVDRVRARRLGRARRVTFWRRSRGTALPSQE